MNFEDEILKGMQQKSAESNSSNQMNVNRISATKSNIDFGSGTPVIFNLNSEMINSGFGRPVRESADTEENENK